jgi:hypothetical protein
VVPEESNQRAVPQFKLAMELCDHAQVVTNERDQLF